MSGAVCPACGVAVIPGYVKCPKCHAPLPRTRRSSLPIGGTAIEKSNSLVVPALLVVVIVGGLVAAYLGLRSTGSASPAANAARNPPETMSTTPVREPTADPNAPATRPGPDLSPTPSGSAKPPSADTLALGLDKELKRQRLWATVSVVGDHVDIRSGSCNDNAMRRELDSAATGFKSAGLARLRCMTQSGQVVFERGL